MFGRNIADIIRLEKESAENQYKSALLRTVSHELRTPINAILTITEMISANKEISAENIERLNIISGTCNYVLCLVNDLLDYAQIIAGCLKISRISFNIHKLLAECITLIKIQLKERGIQIDLIKKNLPEFIFSDPYRLKQVILNLLSNANKFTQKGFILLEAEYINDKITIKCKDTGIGIPTDKISTLFSQFGRIEESFFINHQGVGLGLMISNMLVKELGGKKINVESVFGKGSCFSFHLKVNEKTGSYLEIPDENPNIDLPSIFIKSLNSSIEILIVDDAYFNVVALMQILKTEGIACAYSLDGEDAIFKIKSKKYACVLMDCEMPILNGWETTKKIFELYSNHEIDLVPPIVGCTAHACETIRLKCLEVGMVDVIVKPCPKKEMIRKVKYWIESNFEE